MELHEALHEEWRLRHGRNARYSLRAFARDLGTDHATLSQILRGRRALSPRMARRFGERLRLPANVIASAGQDAHEHAVARLVRAPGFRPDSRWIAVRAGIPVDAVNVALVGLLTHGDLVMKSPVSWSLNGGPHA